MPGQGEGLPGPLAGFQHDGAWDEAVPSAALAAALEAAAGPDGLYAGADVDALVGIARHWAAVESWAAAGLLGTLRAMTREGSEGRPLLRRRADLPDGWDDSLNYEICGALAMGPVSAGNLAALAWTLGTRLPGTGRMLADGTLTRAKAKLIARVFDPLNDGEAARAEALLLSEVAGKTYYQVERLAWRAALAVAPDVAERRRTAAERERARVTVFREESGAVGLSGRDLPTAQALSGHANIVARAKEYQASGAFGGETVGRLEALAYLHLLNGVTAADAIAFARTVTTEPPDGTGHGEDGPDEDSEDKADKHRDPRGGCAATAAPPDGTGHGRDGDSGNRRDQADSGADGSDCAESHGDARGTDEDGGAECPGGDEGPDDAGPDDDGGEPRGGRGSDSGGDGPSGAGGRPVVLPEVVVPLATLLGLAERPGQNRLLGSLDPALARDLAAAAARSPGSRWEVTIVDEHGYAVGHGLGSTRHRRRQGPHPPGPASCALPARVNVTVTEAFLRELAAQAARSRPGAQPRPGAPPGGWSFVPRALTGEYGTWTLTVPGGQQLTTRFDVVPTHACGHTHEVSSYQPSARLRRLVQVRDHECTFPPCSRPAHDSDFEHAIPYDQGGRTDACNAGARSRRCHQVKQMPGWNVTQPQPGWHQWTTPTGRAYVQGPWRYTA